MLSSPWDELAIRVVEFQRLLGIFLSGAVGKFSAPPLPILRLKVLQWLCF
jgi:hypothetical protein